MKSILALCQEAADLAAVRRPESLFSGSSMSDHIFQSVAKSTLDSLLRYGDWPELTKEATLFAYPHCKEYFFDDFCPDFYAMLTDTIYIKDTSEKIIGAINPQKWMASKYFFDNGGLVKFQLQNGKIKFLNLPDFPVKIVFCYRANTICREAKTYNEKSALTADSDIPVFDEYLVKLGILWRWLKRSGLDYTQEYAEYEAEVKKKFAASSGISDIALDTPYGNDSPQGVRINVKVLR